MLTYTHLRNSSCFKTIAQGNCGDVLSHKIICNRAFWEGNRERVRYLQNKMQWTIAMTCSPIVGSKLDEPLRLLSLATCLYRYAVRCAGLLNVAVVVAAISTIIHLHHDDLYIRSFCTKRRPLGIHANLRQAVVFFGDGPNMASESTVSNTELSEFFGAHRILGRELNEFSSAFNLCA